MVYKDENITKINMADVYKYLPTEPPVLRIEDQIRGGHGLRILKNYCDELYRVNRKYFDELENANTTLHRVQSEKKELDEELCIVKGEVTRLKGAQFQESSNARSKQDLERLLIQETDQRIAQEKESARLGMLLKESKTEFAQYKKQVHDDAETVVQQAKEIAECKETIEILNSDLKQAEFNRDSVMVTLVGVERELTKEKNKLADANQRIEVLTQIEQTLRDEVAALHKRMKEILEANKDLTKRYQLVRKNNTLKRSEFDELNNELQEAKNACILAIKARKQHEVEVVGLNKDKEALKECINGLEAVIEKKNGEITDLMTRVSDMINEYEDKLEKKEEQMTQISSQIVEAEMNSKQRVAAANASLQKKPTLDAEVLGDIERKFQIKERTYKEEIAELRNVIEDKDKIIADDEDIISALRAAQFKPRMDVLKGLEVEMKERVSQYALELEMLETSFLCPKTVTPLKRPVTLLPCGHSFSATAIEIIKEENLGNLCCTECTQKTTGSYFNDQLYSMTERFHSMNHYTKALASWVKVLKLDEVDKDS